MQPQALYAMHTGDIPQTNHKDALFSIFGHGVTLTFDLLTPKPEKLIFVPTRTADANFFGETPLVDGYHGNMTEDTHVLDG